MKFKADIDVMPLPALLDPQGKTVSASMKNLGLDAIENVRIGKHISLEVEAADQSEAETLVNDACKRLLVNEIMEFYTVRLEKLEAISS